MSGPTARIVRLCGTFSVILALGGASLAGCGATNDADSGCGQPFREPLNANSLQHIIDPKSAEADQLWRKAAANYMLAIKGQLEGREAVQLESLEAVADRLHSAALHLLRRLRTEDDALGVSPPRLSARSVVVFAVFREPKGARA